VWCGGGTGGRGGTGDGSLYQALAELVLWIKHPLPPLYNTPQTLR